MKKESICGNHELLLMVIYMKETLEQETQKSCLESYISLAVVCV
jgi:hypothetical protein